MHTNVELILTLTGGFAAALLLGYFTQRLRLSPIVGYLLAGIAVGPFTPGFTADRHLAEQLAEIGIILLMFGVGLSFHLKELLAVRRIAIPGALVQSAVATGLGVLVAQALGWGLVAGIVYGLAISVASTVVLIRVLADNDDLHTPAGHIAVGWLVVEDLFTVAALVLLPALFGGAAAQSGGGGSVALALGIALVKIAALIAAVFVVGGRFVPWLLSRVARTRSRELFTLTVLTLALGIAVGSAQLFGVSMALGAFLAGMIVGRSEFSLRAAAEALPMRDAFAVLFFVSVGMLLDWQQVAASPGPALLTLAIVIVGKPLAALAITLVRGYPLRTALAVAVALAQIGEFSFILAALGGQLGLLPDGADDALVGAAILSIALNPLLYRTIDPLSRWALRRPGLARLLAGRRGFGEATAAADTPFAAVVIGYGPVGRTVVRLLRENELVPSVIELNLDTVRELHAEEVAAVYGDATHPDVLRGAGIERAGALILTASGLASAPEIIRAARALNPALRVLARVDYLPQRDELRRAGADEVLAGEAEVALGLTERLLTALGASPEQIDRERERLRADLATDGPRV